MPRRGRGGVVDAERLDDDIEILDTGVGGRSGDAEVVGQAPTSGLSPLAGLAGLAVGAVALIGVITAGNTPAPEPPAPSVTIPVEPVSLEEQERAAEIAELEATYGVEIGDGPDLVWQAITWKIDTNEFAWIDNGFVGQDATTEWTIRLENAFPSVRQRDSLEISHPGYEVRLFDGVRLLTPTSGSVDHVLVAANDREPVRFELPGLEDGPSTDLARVARIWHDGVVIDEKLILLGYQHLEVDLDVLGVRSGRELAGFDYVAIGPDLVIPRRAGQPGGVGVDAEAILFDEIGATETELADFELVNTSAGRPEVLVVDLVGGDVDLVEFEGLDWADSVAATANGAALVWSDSDDGSWLSTSADGEVWSTRPLALDDASIWFNEMRAYTLPVGEPGSIRRSGDLGRNWQRTRRPFTSSVDGLAVDDVLIVLEEPAAPWADAPVVLSFSGYELTISGDASFFDLVDASSGDLTARGPIDVATRATAFAPLSDGLVIADPTSGEPLLTVPLGTLLRAFDEANGEVPPDIAVTRWSPDADDPEWSIRPIDAVFLDAVRVDFVPGPDHLLAVVTTTRGYDYYIASTAT